MEIWQRLYAMIWIAFFEFLLVMTSAAFSPESPWIRVYLVGGHVAVGSLMAGIAFWNSRDLVATKVPGRVKRISKSTFQMTLIVGAIGILMAVFQIMDIQTSYAIPVLNITIYNVFQFFHAMAAFAIITQAAATAIAYDMWEDREWEKETQPGEVPINPATVAAKAAHQAMHPPQ